MMFSRARNQDSANSPLTGGLPAFTPQLVARAARKAEEKKPEPVPVRPPAAAPAATVVIDLSDAVRGVIAAGKFLFRHHQSRKAAERALDGRAVELARVHQGVVGVPDLLMTGVCTRGQAQTCFARLESLGVCRFLATYEGESIYVFPAFLARAWSCEYCASEFPVPPDTERSVTCECGNCGARMAQKIIA